MHSTSIALYLVISTLKQKRHYKFRVHHRQIMSGITASASISLNKPELASTEELAQSSVE